MIDFSLKVGRAKRYPHAARHLATCRSLAERIGDWGGTSDHGGYGSQLRRDHGRKYGFWGLVPESASVVPPAPGAAEASGPAMNRGPAPVGDPGLEQGELHF